MKEKYIPKVPGELRRKRDEWLLELKLELTRILRDNGKCLNFGIGSKTMWMEFKGLGENSNTGIVLAGGDLYRVNLISLPGKDPYPDFRVGVDPSVFDPTNGIPIHLLLDLVEQYPINPFSI